LDHGGTGPLFGTDAPDYLGDCNSLAETHAWFDSRVAHHLSNVIEMLQFPTRD
jgi:hypothetical protein